MTGIYSSLPPTHKLPREPINAMRARAGERPLCFNRPDYPATVEVQDGWTADGRRRMVEIPNPMTKGCASWEVHPAEDPMTESVPGREGWRCWGCRLLPTDPRVVIRAAASELW